jgi:hypothetical protein
MQDQFVRVTVETSVATAIDHALSILRERRNSLIEQSPQRELIENSSALNATDAAVRDLTILSVTIKLAEVQTLRAAKPQHTRAS